MRFFFPPAIFKGVARVVFSELSCGAFTDWKEIFGFLISQSVVMVHQAENPQILLNRICVIKHIIKLRSDRRLCQRQITR